jgi:hypothetical protein
LPPSVAGRPQVGNIVDSVEHTVDILVADTEPVDASQPECQEHCIVVLTQLRQGKVHAKAYAHAQFYATDAEDVVDFLLREVVDRLVGSNAVFVEPARLRITIEYDGAMPEHGQSMCAGQPGGAGADDRDLLSGVGAALEKLHVVLEYRVRGISLQQPDIDRLLLVQVADTGFFAQHFRGTDAGAHATHDVLAQDRMCGTLYVVAADFLNESGNVDAGRAGFRAGRVVTEITPVCLDECLRT